MHLLMYRSFMGYDASASYPRSHDVHIRLCVPIYAQPPHATQGRHGYVCPFLDICIPYAFHIRTHMNMYAHAGTTGARRVSVAPRLNQHAVDIYTYAHTPTHHQRQRHRPPSISTSIHTYIYMRGTHPHLPPTTPTASPSKRPTSMRGGTWAKQ